VIFIRDFFKLYAFNLLTSTLVPGINYFVVITHPLHQLQVLNVKQYLKPRQSSHYNRISRMTNASTEPR